MSNMAYKNKITSIIQLYSYLFITTRFIFINQSKILMNTGARIPSWKHLRKKMIGMAPDGKRDIELLLIYGIS